MGDLKTNFCWGPSKIKPFLFWSNYLLLMQVILRTFKFSTMYNHHALDGPPWLGQWEGGILTSWVIISFKINILKLISAIYPVWKIVLSCPVVAEFL